MKHVHKYKKALLGKEYLIYRCMIPGCTHYVPAQLMENRPAACWECGETFNVTYDMVRKGKEISKLRCPKCRKNKRDYSKVEAVLSVLTSMDFQDEEE